MNTQATMTMLKADSFYSYGKSAMSSEVSIFDVKHHTPSNQLNSFKIDEDEWAFDLSNNSQDSEISSSEGDSSLSYSESPSSSGNGGSRNARNALSCASRNSSYTNTNTSNNTSNSNLTVICEVEDKKAPMSCRTFETDIVGCAVTTSCTIEGLRLVQDDFGEDAEFKVRVCVGEREYIAWRRFGDFRAFGEACKQYSASMPTYAYNSGGGGSGFVLTHTVAAWQAVVAHRPWFRRNLEISYLLEELSLYETFLRCVLFETPTIDLLLDFMR
jgi:hypothetical protein